MNKFKKILYSKLLFFILITGIILFLNLTPLIFQAKHTPPERQFSFVHNNIQDFYFYQSLMNQGANGAWLISDPFTLEPHQPSIIFAYFAWFGKAAKILHLSYPMMYHLIRIISGITFLFFIFYFLFFIKIPYPRLAFFLFVFAAPLMNGNVPYMNWWTGIDPIRRAFYLPHHLIGGILLVITVIKIINFINKPQKGNLIQLISLAALMSFIHTPSLFILILILPPTLIIYSLFNISNSDLITNFKFQIKNYFGLLVYWFIGLLVLFLMVSQTNNGFPWNQYITWEKNLQFPLGKELIPALGILVPFAIIGIFRSLFSRKFEYILITCWLVVPFLLIPFAKILNISNIRLIQGVPYLPLSILAVMGITALIKFSKVSVFILEKFKIQSSNIKSNSKSKFSKIIGLLDYWIIGLFVLLFIVFTLPTLQWSLNDQIREYWTLYSNVYLDKRLFKAFNFINSYFSRKINTISTFYTGNYLPVFTNSSSFAGHFGYTYNVAEKEKIIAKFFSNKITEQEAKTLILNNKIDLVFQGYEEKPLYNGYLYPQILKPIYDVDGITVYTVK